MSKRTPMDRVRPIPSCKKHPGVPAVKGSHLCASCLHYQKLGPQLMGTEKPKATPEAKK